MRATVWQFEHSVALPFFGIGKKTDFYQSCGHCWVFWICWHIECSTLTASSCRIWTSSAGIPLPAIGLFAVMPPKACEGHLTSHSRMSGSRWVTTPLWLSRSLWLFLYSSSVYSCHLFLISSASVRSYCFCPLSCPSLHEIFPWYLQFSWSLVFPILLFSSIYLHCSLKKTFLSLLIFSGILSSVGNIFPFLLCLWLLFFP